MCPCPLLHDSVNWCNQFGELLSTARAQLSDLTFTFHFHALEKEMATQSSVLAWRNPGTGEPGGLPSMGSHRVGLDWSDLAAAAARVPRWCNGKESPADAGDAGSILESGRYPGRGSGTPLQYSCLENSMDRWAWQATVPGVVKSETQRKTHTHTHHTTPHHTTPHTHTHTE